MRDVDVCGARFEWVSLVAGLDDSSFFFFSVCLFVCLSDDEFSCTGVSSSSAGGGGRKERRRQGDATAGPSGNLNHHQGPLSSSSGREKRNLNEENTVAGPPAKKIQPHRSMTPMKTNDDMFPDDDDDIFLMAVEIPTEADSTTLELKAEQPKTERRPSPLPSALTLTRPSAVPPAQRPSPARCFTYLSTHLRLRAANVGSPSVDTACVKVIFRIVFCPSLLLHLHGFGCVTGLRVHYSEQAGRQGGTVETGRHHQRRNWRTGNRLLSPSP